MGSSNDYTMCCRRFHDNLHPDMKYSIKSHTALVLSLIYIGRVLSECISSDMCEYGSTSLENTQIQLSQKDVFFPKSCVAACVDREWCLGLTDDKENRMCIFHLGNDGDTCPSLRAMDPGLTLNLKKILQRGLLIGRFESLSFMSVAQ